MYNPAAGAGPFSEIQKMCGGTSVYYSVVLRRHDALDVVSHMHDGRGTGTSTKAEGIFEEREKGRRYW